MLTCRVLLIGLFSCSRRRDTGSTIIHTSNATLLSFSIAMSSLWPINYINQTHNENLKTEFCPLIRVLPFYKSHPGATCTPDSMPKF